MSVFPKVTAAHEMAFTRKRKKEKKHKTKK